MPPKPLRTSGPVDLTPTEWDSNMVEEGTERNYRQQTSTILSQFEKLATIFSINQSVDQGVFNGDQ